MEAWSLCNPYRMDYQLSHATMLYPVSHDNKYILTQLDVPVKG